MERQRKRGGKKRGLGSTYTEWFSQLPTPTPEGGHGVGPTRFQVCLFTARKLSKPSHNNPYLEPNINIKGSKIKSWEKTNKQSP